MREIVLDTETTGLNPLQGDRMVEIGCVEVENGLATGEVYHRYFDPQRDMPAGAERVHGLSEEFLKGKPLFSQEVDSFLEFIGNDPLVIHNAPFDMGFMNAELARTGYKNLSFDRVIDTLPMARKKFPGAPASLDALCKRFGIDLSTRELHGALLDARLLADVYLELCGGRQRDFNMDADAKTQEAVSADLVQDRSFHKARDFSVSKEELLAHESFLNKIKDPVWKKKG